MHDIVHELTIDASLDEVYAAVSTGPGLARWWSSDVSLESDGRHRPDRGRSRATCSAWGSTTGPW